MAKLIDLGSAKPDSPIYCGGFSIFSVPSRASLLASKSKPPSTKAGVPPDSDAQDRSAPPNRAADDRTSGRMDPPEDVEPPSAQG